jgi:hypothetical protein
MAAAALGAGLDAQWACAEALRDTAAAAWASASLARAVRSAAAGQGAFS